MYPTDLAKWYRSGNALATVSLFDLENDPSESNNLAKQYPDLVKELLVEAENLIANAPQTCNVHVK